jgi:hypothetical protein
MGYEPGDLALLYPAYLHNTGGYLGISHDLARPDPSLECLAQLGILVRVTGIRCEHGDSNWLAFVGHRQQLEVQVVGRPSRRRVIVVSGGWLVPVYQSHRLTIMTTPNQVSLAPEMPEVIWGHLAGLFGRPDLARESILTVMSVDRWAGTVNARLASSGIIITGIPVDWLRAA